MSVLVTSKTALKINAVRKFFEDNFEEKYLIIPIADEISIQTSHEQPIEIGQAMKCAYERLTLVPKNNTYNYIISIENYIFFDENWYDNCLIGVQKLGKLGFWYSNPIKEYRVPVPFNITSKNDLTKITGTVGDIIHKNDPTIPSNDWFKLTTTFNRETQIYETLKGNLDLF